MKRIIASLVALDWLILRRVEKFTHKFQRLTGKTNFWLSKICMLSMAGVTVARDILLVEPVQILLMDIVLAVVIITVVVPIINMTEEIAEKNVSRGLANGGKSEEAALFRISQILFYIGIIMISQLPLFLVIYTFFIAYLYFMACDPLPPCKSSAAEWVKGIFAPKQSLVPASEKC